MAIWVGTSVSVYLGNPRLEGSTRRGLKRLASPLRHNLDTRKRDTAILDVGMNLNHPRLNRHIPDVNTELPRKKRKEVEGGGHDIYLSKRTG